MVKAKVQCKFKVSAKLIKKKYLFKLQTVYKCIYYSQMRSKSRHKEKICTDVFAKTCPLFSMDAIKYSLSSRDLLLGDLGGPCTGMIQCPDQENHVCEIIDGIGKCKGMVIFITFLEVKQSHFPIK